MKKIIFLSLFLGFVAGSASADETKITNKVEKKSVELSKDAQAALKKWNASFVLYTIDEYAESVIDMFKDDVDMLPMATFGDFNGDGEKDIALLGHDKKTEYALILLKVKKGYEVLVMEDDDYRSPDTHQIVGPSGRQVGLGTYLQHVANGELKFKKKPSAKLEAVQVETFGGSSSQYYVKDGDVVEYKGIE